MFQERTTRRVRPTVSAYHGAARTGMCMVCAAPSASMQSTASEPAGAHRQAAAGGARTRWWCRHRAMPAAQHTWAGVRTACAHARTARVWPGSYACASVHGDAVPQASTLPLPPALWLDFSAHVVRRCTVGLWAWSSQPTQRKTGVRPRPGGLAWRRSWAPVHIVLTGVVPGGARQQLPVQQRSPLPAHVHHRSRASHMSNRVRLVVALGRGRLGQEGVRSQ